MQSLKFNYDLLFLKQEMIAIFKPVYPNLSFFAGRFYKSFIFFSLAFYPFRAYEQMN